MPTPFLTFSGAACAPVFDAYRWRGTTYPPGAFPAFVRAVRDTWPGAILAFTVSHMTALTRSGIVLHFAITEGEGMVNVADEPG